MCPTDANGVYSLPPGYLATTGDTIQVSEHNPPLEDIASALTGRLPRNGNAPMTGPLKATDGTVGAPAFTFASAPTVGFYKTANGIGVSVGGVQVFEFTSVPSTTPIGAMVDWPAFVAPSGWLICQGQGLSTTTYATLFSVIGNQFGSFGPGNFALPDLRSRVSAGYDVTTGVLPGASVMGALLGAATVPIAQINLPNYTLPDTLGVAVGSGAIGLSAAAGGVLNNQGVGGGANVTGGGGAYNIGSVTVNDTRAWVKTGSVTSGGSGTALANVQPTIILNKIIFTGVL